MCRNIKVLHNFEPPTTDDEVHSAALQYVRKVSGMTKPSQANEAVFEQAVEAVAEVTRTLLAGLVTSNFLSRRLSQPVEELAVDSEENRVQRARAEAALEATSVELQRSARFSADASHQLKTPVTVLRAGLEELLARENHTPRECDEISALIHQTYRLTGVIDDLQALYTLGDTLANSDRWPNWYKGNEFRAIRDKSLKGGK